MKIEVKSEHEAVIEAVAGCRFEVVDTGNGWLRISRVLKNGGGCTLVKCEDPPDVAKLVGCFRFVHLR